MQCTQADDSGNNTVDVDVGARRADGDLRADSQRLLRQRHVTGWPLHRGKRVRRTVPTGLGDPDNDHPAGTRHRRGRRVGRRHDGPGHDPRSRYRRLRGRDLDGRQRLGKLRAPSRRAAVPEPEQRLRAVRRRHHLVDVLGHRQPTAPSRPGCRGTAATQSLSGGRNLRAWSRWRSSPTAATGAR